MAPDILVTAFLGLLALAAVTDIRARRVPNELVVVLLAVGIAGGAMHASVAGSVSSAILGALAGLAVWLPFWLLGLLGAGDVKFFAAASAWIGPSLSWRASVAVAILGGLLGVVMLVSQRGLRRSAEFGAMGLTNARAVIDGASTGTVEASKRTFPYAVPMAIAVAVAAFYPQLF